MQLTVYARDVTEIVANANDYSYEQWFWFIKEPNGDIEALLKLILV